MNCLELKWFKSSYKTFLAILYTRLKVEDKLESTLWRVEQFVKRGSLVKTCRVTVCAVYSSIKTTEHTERCATYIPERESIVQCK